MRNISCSLLPRSSSRCSPDDQGSSSAAAGRGAVAVPCPVIPPSIHAGQHPCGPAWMLAEQCSLQRQRWCCCPRPRWCSASIHADQHACLPAWMLAEQRPLQRRWRCRRPRGAASIGAGHHFGGSEEAQDPVRWAHSRTLANGRRTHKGTPSSPSGHRGAGHPVGGCPSPLRARPTPICTHIHSTWSTY